MFENVWLFFLSSSQYLVSHYGAGMLVYEGLLTLYVVVNFGLSTFMDPGIYVHGRLKFEFYQLWLPDFSVS